MSFNFDCGGDSNGTYNAADKQIHLGFVGLRRSIFCSQIIFNVNEVLIILRKDSQI